jgi:hypothetical protein
VRASAWGARRDTSMSAESSELVLFVDNDEPHYRQKIAIFRALARKKDRGIYEPRLAPQAFGALLNSAAKKYVREFGGRGDRWNSLFSPMQRHVAAAHLAEEFVDWYRTDYTPPAPKRRV